MSGRWKVIVADSDPAARRALVGPLSRLSDFAVDEARSATEVFSAVERNPFDVIILDVDLPDLDGRELCRTLRQRGISAPILTMIDSDNEADVVLALDSGANDCIVKPPHIGVFLARMRAHLRQYAQSDQLGLPIQHYIFRPNTKLLIDTVRRKKITLTERETALLKYLYRAQNSGASRDQLLAAVWGYNCDAETHTVETHVWRLRRKLEQDPRNARILISEAGGYRLCTDASLSTFFGRTSQQIVTAPIQ